MAALVAVGLAGGISIVVGTAIFGLAVSFLAPFHVIFINLVIWVGQQLIFFGIFMAAATVFSTIEIFETGKEPVLL